MNNNQKRLKPEILKANIGAKRKSTKPKVAYQRGKGGSGPTMAEQVQRLGWRK